MRPSGKLTRQVPPGGRRGQEPGVDAGSSVDRHAGFSGAGSIDSRGRPSGLISTTARAAGAGAVIAGFHVLARVPWPLARRLGAATGAVFHRLLSRRRRIAAVNLALCFPDRSEAWRRRTERATFRNVGVMIAEIARAWCRRRAGSLPAHRIEGLEHLLEARRGCQPVLLVTGHFTCMELAGRLVGERVSAAAVYRPLGNERLEQWQNRCRRRYAVAMISKRDVRGMLRHLRCGGLLWYAPDQDPGPERGAFVPFFGRCTATAIATWRLARLTGAAVLPMWPRREADGSYTVRIDAALPGSEDATPDRLLAAFNAGIEAAVRQAPEQYFWLHRRFKTRPGGEASPYAAGAK